jgi:hypothetical protein
MGSASPMAGAKFGVTIQQIVGTLEKAFTFDAPTVSFMMYSPVGEKMQNRVVSNAASVTISGLNFGARDVTQTVMMKLDVCASTSWSSYTTLSCDASQSITNGKAFYTTVSVSTLTGTASTYFTFDAPIVSMAATDNAPSSGGASVTLRGLNFASDDRTISASIGGKNECATLSWTSLTEVRCTMNSPPALGTASSSVTISAIVGTVLAHFTFDSPVMSSLVEVNSPTTVGDYLTILGQNFGASDFSSTLQISSAQCSTSQWISETAVRCKTPSGSGKSVTTAVTVAAVVGTRLGLYTYDSPVSSHLTGTNSVMSGGSTLTLVGLNFAADMASPTA